MSSLLQSRIAEDARHRVGIQLAQQPLNILDRCPELVAVPDTLDVFARVDRDGVEFVRICTRHQWASAWAFHSHMVEPCPSCELPKREQDGLGRYLDLLAAPVRRV